MIFFLSSLLCIGLDICFRKLQPDGNL